MNKITNTNLFAFFRIRPHGISEMISLSGKGPILVISIIRNNPISIKSFIILLQFTLSPSIPWILMRFLIKNSFRYIFYFEKFRGLCLILKAVSTWPLLSLTTLYCMSERLLLLLQINWAIYIMLQPKFAKSIDISVFLLSQHFLRTSKTAHRFDVRYLKKKQPVSVSGPKTLRISH